MIFSVILKKVRKKQLYGKDEKGWLIEKCCAIDAIDLADIYTVDIPSIGRKKLKISAQTDEPF